MKELKNIRRGRIKEYADKYPAAVYTPVDPALDYNPLWNHKADCAFPCATENEINGKDAENLVKNGVILVSEGANMPTTPEGINVYHDHGILYGPAKAANAGGVSVSGLEMTQNSMRLNWTRQEVDERLHTIMKTIHRTCLDAAAQYGTPGNYMNGANIAGLSRSWNPCSIRGWSRRLTRTMPRAPDRSPIPRSFSRQYEFWFWGWYLKQYLPADPEQAANEKGDLHG